MAYNPALNHQALVAAIRSRFDNVPPSVDRAGQIVNAVALELIKAGEVDAGLLYKASGTNWRGIASVVWDGGLDEDGNPLNTPEFRLSPPPSGIRRVRAVIDLNKRVQIGAEIDVY